MTSVYDIISTIKTFLRDHPIVNYVNYGDITQVDLNKTSMFPLSHFFISNVTMTEHAMRVTVSLLFLDIVDYTKDYNADDLGDRQDASNLIDVYNTQLQIANALIQDLRRGNLYRNKYQLAGDPVCEPFKDRFENELAGWSVDIAIDIANDISVC
jgi:hypothetical protein